VRVRKIERGGRQTERESEEDREGETDRETEMKRL
jgi:hypothetical protein